jgi:hypothetical protein
MNKFRFSMLFAAALTIVSLALPLSAASTPNPDNGSVGITAPQQPSTDNEQIEPVAPPPCDGDFAPVAPPPDDGDFLPSVAPPPCDGDFLPPVAPPPCDGD